MSVSLDDDMSVKTLNHTNLLFLIQETGSLQLMLVSCLLKLLFSQSHTVEQTISVT